MSNFLELKRGIQTVIIINSVCLPIQKIRYVEKESINCEYFNGAWSTIFVVFKGRC
ncbi:MAG: hypothetical protein ACI9GM_001704 [Salibacteraceae bacterium]|jgi:hypothetical protein